MFIVQWALVLLPGGRLLCFIVCLVTFRGKYLDSEENRIAVMTIESHIVLLSGNDEWSDYGNAKAYRDPCDS